MKLDIHLCLGMMHNKYVAYVNLEGCLTNCFLSCYSSHSVSEKKITKILEFGMLKFNNKIIF